MSKVRINFSNGMFAVPESFVDRFIKDTNASFIKLYIYILRHANENDDMSREQKENFIKMFNKDGKNTRNVYYTKMSREKLLGSTYSQIPENKPPVKF